MRSGPLVGVRAVSLGGVGPVPFCLMLLADLGADVVAIDRPAPVEVADRMISGSGIDVLGRGTRRVEIDLKSAEGRDAAFALARHADVVLEGFRPGVMERLGLGPDVLGAANEQLVYGRMTGYGQGGQLAATAGHDINFIARTGALHSIGRRGGPPQVPLNLVADFGGGGMLLALGVCAALWERAQSRRGQVVDAAMVDGVSLLLASTFEKLASGRWSEERGTNPLDTGAPNYDVYETSDGGWMAVGAREPQFHRALLDGLGLADLPLEVPACDLEERRRVIGDRFRTRTRAEWTTVFGAVNACVSPVLSLTEAGVDPALLAGGTLRQRDGATEPGPAPRFSRTPAAAGSASMRCSADDILGEWADLRSAEH